MEKQSKGRRKRKDPESRDFSCPCGKSYLSYAAAYTHAKNKHEGQKEYVEGIKKPQRQQLKRGRPKEKKVDKQSTQTAKLTLIESTILKVCEHLQDSFHHTILEGNQQRNQYLYEQEFKRLKSQYDNLFNQSQQIFPQDSAFTDALIKDFNAQVAARVRFVCLTLASHGHIDQKLTSELNKCNLWRNRTGVNQAICEALQQWRKYTSEGLAEHASSQNQHNDLDLDI